MKVREFRIEPALPLDRRRFRPRAATSGVVLVTLDDRQFVLHPWDAQRMAEGALAGVESAAALGLNPQSYRTFENRSYDLRFTLRLRDVERVFRWMLLCAKIAQVAGLTTLQEPEQPWGTLYRAPRTPETSLEKGWAA